MTQETALAFPDSTANFHSLTKREYFAALAMQGILASYTDFLSWNTSYESIARGAVEQADVLIKALAKKKS